MDMRVFHRTLASICCALVLVLMPRACEPAFAATIAQSPGTTTLPGLPATFAGDLPCADCQALRYHLDVFPDGTYFRRMTYVGKSDRGFDQIGKWTLSQNGVLELKSEAEASGRFQLGDANTLRALDQAGKPIESAHNSDLKRQGAFAPIEPALRLRGLYSNFADSGWFTECLTGTRMPVAQEAQNAALEEAYSKARPAPKSTLLATVEGRIAMRMPMEGPGPRPTLIVDRFVSVEPGDCDEPI